MRVFNERSGFCEDEILYRKRWIEITKLIMSAQFCAKQLDEQEKLCHYSIDVFMGNKWCRCLHIYCTSQRQ